MCLCVVRVRVREAAADIADVVIVHADVGVISRRYRGMSTRLRLRIIAPLADTGLGA